MINLDQVTVEDLPGSDQLRQRLDNQPFDCTFEISGTVLQVYTFVQEKLFSGSRNSKNESPAGLDIENALTQRVQLNVQNPIELARLERFENDHFVEAIDKLRREFTARGIDAAASHVLVLSRASEPQLWLQHS